MKDIAIQVKGLQKSYKKLHILKDLDFKVEKGSIFALLGSNGAGKTMVVKILTTLLKQDTGTATVNGFDVEERELISLCRVMHELPDRSINGNYNHCTYLTRLSV